MSDLATATQRAIAAAQNRGFILPSGISASAILQLAVIEHQALTPREILGSSRTGTNRTPTLLARGLATIAGVPMEGRGYTYKATEAGRNLLHAARMAGIFDTAKAVA